jgi:hypothetical protein
MHKTTEIEAEKKMPVDLFPLAARHCWRLRLEASTFRLPVPISIKHFLAAMGRFLPHFTTQRQPKIQSFLINSTGFGY